MYHLWHSWKSTRCSACLIQQRVVVVAMGFVLLLSWCHLFIQCIVGVLTVALELFSKNMLQFLPKTDTEKIDNWWV